MKKEIHDKRVSEYMNPAREIPLLPAHAGTPGNRCFARQRRPQADESRAWFIENDR